MKWLQLLCLALCAVLFSTCSKTNTNNYTPVNYTVDLLLPQFAALNAPNNYVYIPNVGARGLIVYRVSFTQFNAFDRSCPYLTSTSCAPIVVINAFTCSDTCKNCGSQFNLSTGIATKGPSTYPLTTYQTNFDGVSLVRISN